MKNKKLLIIPIISIIIIVALTTLYVTNPTCWDCGNKVFFSNYWREAGDGSSFRICGNCYIINNAVKDIEEPQSVNVQQAKELYEVLLYKECLTSDEKKELANFIQYFVDNKYIETDRVYDKLISFTVNENDPSLLDEGIGAAYYEDNSLTFADNENRKLSLSHELHHAIENEKLDYGEYEWFIEGFTSLVTFEYFGNTHDSKNSEAFLVRSLCEFVDADVLFNVSAKGDINILISALENCGLKSSDIEQLFKKFKQLTVSESNTSTSTIEERIDVAQFIVNLYCDVNNCNEVSDSLFNAIELFLYQNSDTFDYYYLNSTLKNSGVNSYAFIPLEKLDELYNDATLYFRCS